jgi:hypothetical protein
MKEKYSNKRPLSVFRLSKGASIMRTMMPNIAPYKLPATTGSQYIGCVATIWVKNASSQGLRRLEITNLSSANKHTRASAIPPRNFNTRTIT